MRKTLRFALPGVLIAMLCAGSAAACSRSMPQGSGAVIQPESRINGALLDAAIRAEVNYYRCKHGLKPVSEAAGLRKVAIRHAEWMARSRKLSHKSGVPGQGSVLSRIKSSGLKVRAGSENIGLVARFQLDGRRFRVSGGGGCSFSTSGGAKIPPHSYASLSQHIVRLWMESRGHRRNILDRKVSRVGSGAGFDSRATSCGKFYISQAFAG